jgi:hypothetical protein
MKKCFVFVMIIVLFISGCDTPYLDNRVVPYADPPPPEVPSYVVNIDTVTGGSTKVLPEKEVYASGDYIKIAATPNNGYSFVKWTGTVNSTENPYIFKAEKDEWIIPVFSKDAEPPAEETFTVRVDSATGGSAEALPEKEAYASGEYIKITAIPNDGYSFARWTGTVNSTENPCIFKAEKNEWIIPVFSKNAEPPAEETYAVNMDTITGGSAEVLPEKEVYASGEYIKITAIPNDGYSFTRWTGTVNSTENPYIFKAEKNEWIIPVFSKDAEPPAEETFMVRVDSATGGSAAVNPQKAAYLLNETVKITASAEIGYSFTGWTGTVNTSQNPLTIKVTTDHWIIPRFEQNTVYTLKTEWQPVGGSIVCSAGTRDSFSPGEKCSIQAIPSTGYRFIGWEGDVETANSTIYITFDKDYQVYAQFEKIPEAITYTLAATVSGGGTIRRIPDKPVYYANEVVRLTAIPESGYVFSSWNTAEKAASFDIVMDGNKTVSAAFEKRIWSFIVYMAADNDLEASAIADFNELEAAGLDGKPVSVLVLFDRAPGYDATNGNWTDTRLYEVKTDPGGNNGTIISQRLNCPALGLSTESSIELDMADPLILSRLLTYVKQEYAADNYGLLVWGHGSGWKGSGSVSDGVPEPLKAVAIDDSNNTYMTLASFGSAIAGQGLKVIGFDTCFGALLEVAYQIRNDAAYFVASEGLIPATGWNYQAVFNDFLLGTDTSASQFCNLAVSLFGSQYGGVPGAAISKIDLSKTGALFTAFEGFAKVLAQSMTTDAVRDLVVNIVFQDPLVSRYHGTPPSDLYIDISSFAQRIKDMQTSITGDTSLQASIGTLQSALSDAIVSSWAYGESAAKKLGVYVVGLAGGGVPRSSHESGYIRDSSDAEKSAFVKDSVFWVPNQVPQATSFLDRLLYWSY